MMHLYKTRTEAIDQVKQVLILVVMDDALVL